MFDTTVTNPQWATVAHQLQRSDVYRRAWIVCLLGVAILTAAAMFVLGPTPLPIGGALFLGTVALIVYQPRWGLYFILFCSLVGDAVLIYRYPFTKNLSSAESLLYVHDALIFSPLELYLVLTLVVWIGKGAMQRKLALQMTPLFWAVIAFTACVMIGLIWGLSTGGNVNVALWEARAIFYIPLTLILTQNLIADRGQISTLMWVIMAAIAIEGGIGVLIFLVRYRASLAGVEAITEHAAAIQMNSLFVYLLACWLFGASAQKRYILPLLIPLTVIAYIATQRRAAFAALGMVFIILAILLYKKHRRLFFILVPTAACVALAYLAVFWNSGSALAFGARAVKSIVAPAAGSEDASSNLYRVLEGMNINHTIHLSPIMGVGFGQKFHITVPMPDISFFVWWEYIVHNSVFWMWMKSGLAGFVSLLILMGLSLLRGGQTIWRLRDPNLQAIAFTGTTYLFMHYMYAYVDMSWDIQSMLYVGTMLGLIDIIERIDRQAPINREGLVPVGAKGTRIDKQSTMSQTVPNVNRASKRWMRYRS